MAQARGRAAAAAVWARAVFLLVCAAVVVHAADHSVGGASNGWTKPNGNTLPVTYLQDWASTQSFSRGDHLLFNYNPAAHNVLVVSLADYVICNTLSPIAKYVSGEDTVPVPVGPSYYICGTPTHCESGQKFNITAASTATNSGAAVGVNAAVPVGQAFIAATVAIVAIIAPW